MPEPSPVRVNLTRKRATLRRMEDRLTTAEVADLLGIKPVTWRGYVSHRKPVNNPAPAPDGHFDARTPYWNRSTVEAWRDARPSGSDGKRVEPRHSTWFHGVERSGGDSGEQQRETGHAALT